MTPPGIGEWAVILLIAVLIFGGKKLPEIGSGLGEAIRSFRRGLQESNDEGGSPDGPSDRDAPPPS